MELIFIIKMLIFQIQSQQLFLISVKNPCNSNLILVKKRLFSVLFPWKHVNIHKIKLTFAIRKHENDKDNEQWD